MEDAFQPVDAGILPPLLVDDDVVVPFDTSIAAAPVTWATQFDPMIPKTLPTPAAPTPVIPKPVVPKPVVVAPTPVVPKPVVVAPKPVIPKPAVVVAARFPLFQTSFWVKLGVMAALVLALVLMTRGDVAASVTGVVLFGAYVLATWRSNSLCSPMFLNSMWCKAYKILG